MLCRFLLYSKVNQPHAHMWKWKCQSLSRVWLVATPGTVAHQALCLWHSLGKNIRVGSHSLLQGTFSTQGSNPGLLHCRHILYCLSPQGSQRQWSIKWQCSLRTLMGSQVINLSQVSQNIISSSQTALSSKLRSSLLPAPEETLPSLHAIKIIPSSHLSPSSSLFFISPLWFPFPLTTFCFKQESSPATDNPVCLFTYPFHPEEPGGDRTKKYSTLFNMRMEGGRWEKLGTLTHF